MPQSVLSLFQAGRVGQASFAKIIEVKLEIFQPRLAAGGYQWIVKVTIINIYI